jgi:hypothetical protein
MVTGHIRHIIYLSEAAFLAEHPRASAAVISITEPSRLAPVPEGWGAVLRVQFMDAEFDTAMLERLAARGKSLDLAAKGYPCRAHCAPILAFLDQLADASSITELVVHCHAGKRRSAAVAKFAAECFGVRGVEGRGFNRTVYALLRDPACFDHLVADTPKVGFFARVARLFG